VVVAVAGVAVTRAGVARPVVMAGVAVIPVVVVVSRVVVIVPSRHPA
jgi:hypothetical protein